MAKDIFRFSPEYYQVDTLRSENFSEQTLRKEYSRLRKLAFNRMRRLQKQFNLKKPEKIGEENIADLRRLKPGSLTREQLPYALQSAYEYLNRADTTVKGYREKRTRFLKTAQSHNYEVNESSYEDFGLFMREWRQLALNELYGSDRAATLFENLSRLGVSPLDISAKGNFKEYLEKANEIENFNPATDLKKYEKYDPDLILKYVNR